VAAQNLSNRTLDYSDVIVIFYSFARGHRRRRRCPIRWCEHWRHGRPNSSNLRDPLSTAATRLL